MPRLFCISGSMRALTAAALTAVFVLAAVPHITRAAGESKQIQHVRGTIGYQTAESGTDFKPVFGKLELPDDAFAATHAQSAAVLAMPDSSLVSLGENTTVRVGAFNTTAAGPGSTITINGGALRFDIRRPQGGTANYRFVTNTSAVGVRGTVGLISFANNVETVACLSCAADSVTITTASGQISLLTGQIATISAAGVVTTGAITTTVLGTFTAAGVPTSAEATAVAAGLPASTGTIAGMSTGTAAAVGAAVVGAGTAIGVIASPGSPPSQTSSNSNTGNNNNNSNGQPGNLNLNNSARLQLGLPSPSPSPGARSIPAPTMAAPGGHGGR
jgi:hypothetical protein